MALKDDTGQPIKRSEVEAKKTDNNFWLYTLGGGALSFGASFFAGAMIERGVESEDRAVLWSVTGVGTVVGTLIFAHNGKVRDYNLAVEAVKDSRQQELGKKIKGEQQRQETLSTERKRLEDERKRQEAERAKLLEQIRDKQKKEDQP
jgi:uncharacterized protein YlxW (UPF0749 family)